MNITMEMRKFVAPEIITGNNARLIIGRYIQHFAVKKPMIVTDQELLKFSWFQDIIKEIEGSVTEYSIFDQVTSNPRRIYMTP
jgi:alcohol dehydrogenase